ncbi:MAG TPA: carboxypeptidase regulatory-like domain-containing protein [Epsilonproteobacteria bacterium]|nr:carboxypeptidase regulatory-like domain-containing protein [Campylobacterota bacterium]
MTKTRIILASAFLLLFLFSGCVQRELVLNAPDVQQSQDNTWANETNVEENVDISDLEDNVTVEDETLINEDMPVEKMERVTFPVSEYKHLARTGKGTVKGTIYVKDAYDKRVVGANTRLYLNPITSYSKQWYKESYIGGYKMEKADDRLFNYLRFTASNNDGKFAFYGVPTGSYYLIGTVKCGSECGYDTPKSIRIATQVSVSGNQVVERDLSRLID